jgi:hypothetical protein
MSLLKNTTAAEAGTNDVITAGNHGRIRAGRRRNRAELRSYRGGKVFGLI